MTRNVLAVLGVAAALGFTPGAAFAHAGRARGTKAKMVKKSKPKKAAIEFMLRPDGASSETDRARRPMLTIRISQLSPTD